MKKIYLTLSIFLLALLICSFANAQGHQPADEDWYKAQDLEKQGKYIDAAKMYEKSAAAEKTSSAPEKSNLATDLSQAGYYYSLAGKYNKAVKYLEEALTIFKKLGQEDKVATCLSHFGGVYKSVGNYDRAIKYLEEALDIDKRLGMEDKVAIRLSNIGDVYDSQGQYDKAIEYLEDALEINKKLEMEAVVAIRLNNIGRVFETQGKYGKAIEYFDRALRIDRKLEQDDKISTDLANIGNIYKSREQYDTAIKYYENALDIDKKLGQEYKVALQLNNIGGVYETHGKYVKALGYYEEAIDTAEILEQDNNIAISLANIGNVFKYWDQHEVAVKYYEDALAIDRKLGQEDKVAILLNYIGGVYKSTRQYDNALKYYKEALEINRGLGKEADEALALKNLDMAYRYYWSKHDKAIKPHELKLATDKKFGKDEDISGDLNNVGMICVLQKKYKTAIEYFNESVTLIEKLRKATAGEERRDYLARQISASQLLASAFIKDSNISSAFQSIELSRAKLMAERFARKEKNIRLQEIKQIRETLGEDTAIIVYANVNSEDIIRFTITREELTGREVSRKSFVQSSMDKFRAPIKTLLINQNSLSEIKNEFDNIINYYSSLLREPSLQDEGGQRTGIDKPGESPPRLPDGQGRLLSGEIGKGLYELLIKPMEAQIKDKKHLIIVPGGILAFVPFETLIDRNGQYLVEGHHISYVQSVDIRKLIKSRQYDEKRRPLLAFGGAVYEEAAYDAEVIENETQMAIFKENIYSDLKNIRLELAQKKVFSDFENIRYIKNAYNGLGISTWHDLPCTLNEVNNINKVINKSNIFTGSNVTEKDIKELSRNWTLYNYKVLHFATHGLVVNEVPELSAVVLSQFEEDVGKEDGYLRIEEIVELSLQADLVNLSACETHLTNWRAGRLAGRVDGNAGIFGLTQSFILAGANAVSMSLWLVADESTSQFMATMYGMVQDKGISYAEAITEVKRQFINGDFGEKYKAPYYWAPFVYYGN